MSKRVSLILGDADEQAIAPFLQLGTEQWEALRQWADRHGVPGVKSEAAALRALLQVAVEALRDDVLEAGYVELAEVFNQDADQRAERRAVRDRYAVRSDVVL